MEAFLHYLDTEDPQIRDNAYFYQSIERLVENLKIPELGRLLIKMISLLDEKNITTDIFIALAEVVIGNADRQVSMLY